MYSPEGQDTCVISIQFVVFSYIYKISRERERESCSLLHLQTKWLPVKFAIWPCTVAIVKGDTHSEIHPNVNQRLWCFCLDLAGRACEGAPDPNHVKDILKWIRSSEAENRCVIRSGVKCELWVRKKHQTENRSFLLA